MKTNNPVKQFFLMTLVHCLLFAPLATVGQNLVSNSGFSSGSTGWATNCSIEVNPETAYGGTNGSNYTTGMDAERCLNQDTILSPGLASNWGVNNATASITSYTWNFGANANQSFSSLP
jgi:hypothetical protein